jgi:hypothetical protein
MFVLKQRSIWYLAMTMLLQDEDASKKGFVVIVLNLGPCRLSYEKFPLIFKEDKVYKAIPHKVASVQYFLDDPLLYPFLAILRFFWGSRARGRLQTHLVTQRSDYIFQLQTYGIPTQVLPMDEQNIPTVDYHLQWIQERQIQESSSSVSRDRIATGMIPRRFDVLFGRGTTIAEHTGNLRAFHIVEMNRGRYELAGKFEKTQIADRVVHLIHIAYGRFLRKTPGGWVEVSRDEAREKISHCFRRLRDVENRAEKNSDLASKRDGRESDTLNLDAHASSPKVNMTKKAKPSSSSIFS